MSKNQIPTKQSTSKIIAWAVVVTLSIIGVSLMYWGTFRGIGLGDDSIYYFSAAKNFLLGKGLYRLNGAGIYTPIIHFPPLYPLFLAGLQLIFRSELNEIARGLHLILFGSNIILTGFLGKKLTQSWFAGIFASLGILTAPVMLLYRDAMTEPLFLTFLLLTILGLLAYFERHQLRWCVFSAIAASCMLLTRYAGQGIVVGFALALLFFTDQKFRLRLRNTILFSCIAILPIAVWMIRNYLVAGSFTNRVFNVHLPELSNIKLGLQIFAAWILPISGSRIFWWVIFGFAAYILAIGILWIRNSQVNGIWAYTAPSKTTLAILLSGILYLVSLITSLTFFDASSPLDNRILSPIFVVLLLTIISLTWGALKLNQNRYLSLFVSILLLIWSLLSFQDSFAVLSNNRQTGFVFDTPSWQNSTLVQLLSEVPSETIIYSNESIYLTYILDRPVRWLPERFDPVKDSLRENYTKQIEEMQGYLQKPYNLVAIFKSRFYESSYVPLGETFPSLQTCLDIEEGLFLSTRKEDFYFCK